MNHTFTETITNNNPKIQVDTKLKQILRIIIQKFLSKTISKIISH